MDLTTISGIGDKLAQKIINNFGSEEELLNAIHNFEVDRFTNIEGISQQKAIEIINVALGNPTQVFLKTDHTIKIYEDIIGRIIQFSNTNYGRNRILLINPTKDLDKIWEGLKFAMKAKETVSELPRDDVSNLLKRINPSGRVKPKYDPSKALLVESKVDYNRLLEMELNRYYPIISAEELDNIADFELIVYVYSEGQIELEDTFNVAMVSNDSAKFEIVPEVVLSYFWENYDLLCNILKLKKILKGETILSEVIKILDSLGSYSVDGTVFDDAVEAAKKRADEKLKNNIKEVDLKGEEVLALLKEDMPDKIREIFEQVIKIAREEIKDETGCSFDPFIQKYPIEIDYQELERVKKLELAKEYINAFERKVNAASQLSKFKEMVEAEIQEILEFDYEFALGCFAYYYDLNPPQIGDGFCFREALHLNLALKNSANIQKIDYELESSDNVVLLTGANSGGKTTLLETLAQVSIMTQMGLPVCAKKAMVKLVDEVYFFSKSKSLDAGAFESFLNTFIPIVIKKTDKLILLDELEAITELEAALKIISSFIDFIKNSNSYAVIVTHMAKEILKYTQLRVDGIEAKGLDDEYNLIVDRTPKMNYLAKSTPELILRMIYEKSDGKLQDIYRQILEKF